MTDLLNAGTAPPTERDLFLRDVLEGLAGPRKTLPCKYFYDAAGSLLFDRICEQEEYYPTRTELAIMQAHVGEMTGLLGERCMLIEYGSGSSLKTRVLLDRASDLLSYVPVDISREHLLASAEKILTEYPSLEVLPVVADYTRPFDQPRSVHPSTRATVYFPGSTIGNFHPREALAFLGAIAETCGKGGGLLIGVDLRKDPAVLEPAYNDRLGVTAAFNLNLLQRFNRELGADFVLGDFEHHAFYHEGEGRIEMHLVSLRGQIVTIAGQEIAFEADETIRTECSYKYTLDGFAALASRAGWDVSRVWTDSRGWFSVQYLTVC